MSYLTFYLLGTHYLLSERYLIHVFWSRQLRNGINDN